MYNTCPKCGYTRGEGDSAPLDQCPSCKLIFSKWMKQRFRDERIEDGEGLATRQNRLTSFLDYILHVPASNERWMVFGRMGLYLLFFIWGWQFILLSLHTNEIGNSFMHNINLVFHEAGHVIFRPFGRFMTILGGSLAQLLMPLTVLLMLLIKNRDTFGASIGLWWLSQSLMDLAPYINDARSLQLMLLGGGTGHDRPGMHDWRNILLELDLLNQDYAIAAFVDTMGEVGMLLAFAWGAVVLYRQYQGR